MTTVIYLIGCIALSLMTIIAGIGWGVSTSTVERLSQENSDLAKENKELSVELARQKAHNAILKVALGDKK